MRLNDPLHRLLDAGYSVSFDPIAPSHYRVAASRDGQEAGSQRAIDPETALERLARQLLAKR